jgi:DUF1680 family protein
MKKLLTCMLGIAIVCAVKASVDSTARWQPIIANTVEEKYVPATLESFSGLLNDHIYINLNKRLLQIDSGILLSGFVHRPGSQTWIGEHVGKFLFSASQTYAYTHDEKIKALMDDMVRKYIATQMPDGYIGTYLLKDRWTAWDVWAHKYAIIGLLNYYSITGYAPALETAKKAADLICRTFGTGAGQLDLNTHGEHAGLAPGSILEPMIDIYRYTGDKKYLAFAKYILSNWESATGPKMLTNLQKYGDVTKVGDAKAYEMMSCFVGILKYYKLTGDEKYFTILKTAWQDIVDKRLYITGTASVGEIFLADYKLPATNDVHMGEGCVTVTWVQFNEQMLKITGEVKYAEEIEKAVYNHLFAAENPETGCVSYYTALQGAKPYRCDQGFSCCLSSIPRGISLIPNFVWGKINKQFTVLMYEPGTVKDAITADDGSTISLQLTAATNFPADGSVVYTVTPSAAKKFTINFRIPSWADNYRLSINGEAQTITGTDEVSINRVWQSNDKVQVEFDLDVHVIKGGPSYPNSIAFKRGPQVLAVDSTLNAGDIKALPVVYNSGTGFTIRDATANLPTNWVGKQAWYIGVDNIKQTRALLLVPFADAGQQSSSVQVWLPFAGVNVAER